MISFEAVEQATAASIGRLRRIPATWTAGLECWLYVPENLDSSLAPLVAVHGVGRGARNQARQFMQRARDQGRLVVAPLFDTERWAGYQRIAARGQRADLALLTLLDSVTFQTGVSTRRVAMFGYSGGAQFAHRFAMLHPHRVERLCVCASGWYTWPSATEQAFPHSTGSTRRRRLGEAAESNLGRFLQIPLQVAVGERDNVVDALTRSNVLLDAQQGTHRLQRAQRWVQALQQLAEKRGLRPNARLTVLPDAGHDFRECMRSGLLGSLAMPEAQLHSQPLARAA
jgi:pimeloyl-ACP methyl ester carboxylesterase